LLDFACRLRSGTALRERLGQAFESVGHRFRGPPGSRP
jgi:hypothetical protein